MNQEEEITSDVPSGVKSASLDPALDPDTSPSQLSDEQIARRFEHATGDFDEDNPERAAVEAAADKQDNQKLTDETLEDATAWFMSSNPEETVAYRTLALNVSSDPDVVHEVKWVVQALPRERIAKIRAGTQNSAEGRRRQRQERDLVLEQLDSSAKIAAEGTVVPNLRDPKVLGEYADPVTALRARLQNKPGLIDQISGHVLEVSGYNDDDVREIEAAKN